MSDQACRVYQIVSKYGDLLFTRLLHSTDAADACRILLWFGIMIHMLWVGA
jgi:hypothetical protein